MLLREQAGPLGWILRIVSKAVKFGMKDSVYLHDTADPKSDLSRALKSALKRKTDIQPTLKPGEGELVERIRRQTLQANANNVTRTQAYWKIYQQHPELHWAFLAHLVSRNGGWNMTDLKGDLISRVMTESEQQQFFSFLEQCNALIFQDAYPQLLLYSESRQAKSSLFHLLPFFHVSRFMRPCWERFLQRKASAELTTALIINEQHYIENRVVQNETFKQNVLETWKFQAQSLLQMNQVFFPYSGEFRREVKLAGWVCQNFSLITERIDLGKRLYRLLFGNSDIFRGVLEWASTHEHTGSRSDYWPHLFTSRKSFSVQKEYKPRLQACKLKANSPKLVSPKLTEAWPNQPLPVPEQGDWFQNMSVIDYFERVQATEDYLMTKEYCQTLEAIETAVVWKEKLI